MKAVGERPALSKRGPNDCFMVCPPPPRLSRKLWQLGWNHIFFCRRVCLLFPPSIAIHGKTLLLLFLPFPSILDGLVHQFWAHWIPPTASHSAVPSLLPSSVPSAGSYHGTSLFDSESGRDKKRIGISHANFGVYNISIRQGRLGEH